MNSKLFTNVAVHKMLPASHFKSFTGTSNVKIWKGVETLTFVLRIQEWGKKKKRVKR